MTAKNHSVQIPNELYSEIEKLSAKEYQPTGVFIRSVLARVVEQSKKAQQ